MTNPPLLQWKTLTRPIGILPSVLCGLALTLAGCQQTLPPAEASPYKGVTLNVDAPARVAEMIRDRSRGWQASRDAGVRVRVDGADGDIAFVVPADLPSLVSVGGVAPLPDALVARNGEYAWDSLLPGYSRRLLGYADKWYAVPLLGEAEVFVYRRESFESAEVRKAFASWAEKRGQPVTELRVPATWAEYALAAEFFTEHHPTGKAGPSLAPVPADDDGLDHLFNLVAASHVRRAVREDEQPAATKDEELFSFHYDHKTGESRITSPGFVEALRVLARIHACSAAEGGVAEVFRSGRALMGVVDASVLARLQQSPELRDKLGIAAIPGAVGEKRALNRVPYIGGKGLFGYVRAGSPNKEAAFDLLAEMTGRRRSSEIAFTPAYGGGPTRADHLLRDRWDVFDLDGPRTRDLRETLTLELLQSGLKNPVYVLRIPDAKRHREALAAGLRKTLEKKAEPGAALAEVQARWKKLDDERGPGKHRQEYRLSIGLLADG